MNLSLQDLIAIWGPSLAIAGFVWHHSSTAFEKLGVDIKDVRADIKKVEEKLGADIKKVEEKLGADIKDVRADIKNVEKKVDAVRDRVSKIEGQLAPTSFVTFNAPKNKKNIRSAHSSS